MDFSIHLLAGITLGFLGSLHCVGMCGPLVLALPLGRARGVYRLVLLLVYHISRITVYTLMGVVLGWLGGRLVWFGWQQGLSVAIGVVMLLLAMFFWFWRSPHPGTSDVYRWIRDRYRIYFRQGPGVNIFMVLGFLNGLLPCGLVYVTWGAAAATGSPWLGAWMMGGFGLGTLPALLSLGYITQWLGPTARRYLQQITPAVVALTALLLILRGLNLGIPYLSPKWDTDKKEVRPCCRHRSACE